MLVRLTVLASVKGLYSSRPPGGADWVTCVTEGSYDREGNEGFRGVNTTPIKTPYIQWAAQFSCSDQLYVNCICTLLEWPLWVWNSNGDSKGKSKNDKVCSFHDCMTCSRRNQHFAGVHSDHDPLINTLIRGGKQWLRCIYVTSDSGSVQVGKFSLQLCCVYELSGRQVGMSQTFQGKVVYI